METRASYFFVGLFVLVLTAGAFVFSMWLARASLNDESALYYIYFTGSVTGLQNGSQVQLRGVPVGTVADISIDADNVELIQVTVSIKQGTPIKTDTMATLQLQGITGLSFVQLSGGTQSAPPLEPRPGKRRAVIPARPSPIERVFEHMPEMTAQVVELAARANDLLNDKNREAIANVLQHLDVVMGTAAESRDDIAKLLRDTASAAASLDALATEMKGLTMQVGGDAQLLIQRSQETAQALRRTADEFQGLAAENRTALRDFGETGLYELSQFLIEARGLMTNLNRLTLQFERDPARFLFGDQQKGVEAR